MDNSNSYTVGVVYPNGTANDSNTTPHSFDIVINTPQHIKSMAELDLELDANGSAITLSATSATDDYEQRIQLPLRIDESSITAKYKKKRNMLMIAATILTEDQGQPRELLDNVRTARRQLMGLTTTSEQTKPAAAAPMASAPPPAPAASSATAQALYDKYKSVKEGSGEVDTPPPAPVATPTTAPSPEPVVAVSIPPTTSPPTPTIGQYTNSKVNVLDHPTDRLQLISPPALVDVVCTCLSIAQRQPSPSDPITIKSIMESFPSKSQSELCRQLLIQAVKFAVQTNPTSPPTLPKQVKERFVKLAEHQMKKIEEVLEKKLAKTDALVKQGQEHAGSSVRPNGSKNVEKRSTHAHAPVFDKDRDEDNDFNSASWLPPVTLEELETDQNKPTVAGATTGGSLSSVILKSFKGSEKRNMKKVVSSRAAKVGKNLQTSNFAIIDEFVTAAKVKELRTEIDNVEAHFTASEIWVGKGADVGAQISVPSVRGDKVLWMCGGHVKVDSTLFDSAGVQPKGKGAIEPCELDVKAKIGTTIDKGGIRKISASVMGKFGALKEALESLDKFVFDELTKKDERLARLSSRSDAMLAVYPGGGSRFQRHVDNTAKDGRRLTVLLYLNEEGWTKEDGGLLKVWGKGEIVGFGNGEEEGSVKAPVEVLPLGGRVAMFYSDLVPHEVTPANKSRYAVTVWYYDRVERSEAVAMGADTEKGEEAGDMEAQAEASKFIKETLAGGDGNEVKESVDEAELRRVGHLANELSKKALKIVAGICGAPSEEYFLEAANRMDKRSLRELREGLSKMGV